MTLAILFDLDGTLLDTLEDLTDSVNATMAHFGCPQRTPEQVRQALGNGARQLVALNLPAENAPDTDTALAFYQAYYRAHSAIKTRPYKGIPEALATLGQRYPLAVVSNKPNAATQALCAQWFPGIRARGEDTDCPRKPAPDMIHQAMALLGADRAILVGDSEVDVFTAKNAGIPCLAVTWGFRDRDQLEAAGARYLCAHPQALPQMIEKIQKDMEEEFHGK